MTESTRDEPHILDQIYELSHNPNNIAEAQNIAGLAAAGTTLVGGLPVATTPAGVGALAIGVGGAYDYGAEHGGTQVIIPLEATIVAGVHETTEMVNDVLNGISSFFSEPSSSVPPALETPSAPMDDGSLAMVNPIPSIFDVPTITASETSAPAFSHDESSNAASSINNIFDSTISLIDSTPVLGTDSASHSGAFDSSSSIHSIFDSTPSVIDSTPAWGTDNSGHSYDAFDSSSNHDSTSNSSTGIGDN